MQESGISKRIFGIYEDFKFANVGCRIFIKTGRTYQEKLGMRYLGSAFLALAVFYIVTLFVYLIECIYLKFIGRV